MKTIWLKHIDGFIGDFLNGFFPERNRRAPKSVNRVLIIRPGGMGDAVLLIPMIKKIRYLYKDVEIDILAETRNADVFYLLDFDINVYRYDKINEFLGVLRKQYDLVFDTEQWHKMSSLVARYLGKFTVGFDANSRRKNFDVKVKYSHTEYEVESFLNLLRAYCETLEINMEFDWDYPFLNVENTDKFYDIVIFTGASVDFRKWEKKKYARLLNKLSQKGLKVAFIGSKDDVEFNKTILDMCNNCADDYSGKTNLKETAKVIASSRLLFSTDSGILHIGAALGINTVSLFGPGIEYKWAPKGENHKTVNMYLPCSPCTRFGYTPKCPYDVRCMKEIDVNRVFKAITSLL